MKDALFQRRNSHDYPQSQLSVRCPIEGDVLEVQGGPLQPTRGLHQAPDVITHGTCVRLLASLAPPFLASRHNYRLPFAHTVPPIFTNNELLTSHGRTCSRRLHRQRGHRTWSSGWIRSISRFEAYAAAEGYIHTNCDSS